MSDRCCRTLTDISSALCSFENNPRKKTELFVILVSFSGRRKSKTGLYWGCLFNGGGNDDWAIIYETNRAYPVIFVLNYWKYCVILNDVLFRKIISNSRSFWSTIVFDLVQGSSFSTSLRIYKRITHGYLSN